MVWRLTLPPHLALPDASAVVGAAPALQTVRPRRNVCHHRFAWRQPCADRDSARHVNGTQTAASLRVDTDLVPKLDQALVGVQGHISIAVKDLGSGRGAVLDGDQELAAASLYKLPVLFTVFDLGLGMGEPLMITHEALSYDSGTMELGAGETLTVAEAVERMVTLSANTVSGHARRPGWVRRASMPASPRWAWTRPTTASSG